MNIGNVELREHKAEWIHSRKMYTVGTKLFRQTKRAQYAGLSALNAKMSETVNLEGRGAGLSRNHFSDEFWQKLSRAERKQWDTLLRTKCGERYIEQIYVGNAEIYLQTPNFWKNPIENTETILSICNSWNKTQRSIIPRHSACIRYTSTWKNTVH